MNELTLDGKTYVSSKRAAEITGYAKDYVGQLCREGHVEARLVGRNWYVLETSIRDHRFGKDDTAFVGPEIARRASTTNWEQPRYKAEVPAYVPPLAERIEPEEEKDDSNLEIHEEVAANKPLLSDMQSAWQEWFTRKADIVPEAVIEEDVEAIEEETPIAITALPEEEELYIEQEEVIPVAIADYREEETLDLRTVNEKEGVIIEEKITRRPTFVNSLALQSAFLAVSLIAIVVAAIGTGFAAKYVDFAEYRLSAISFLAGTSVYNR